MFFIALFNGYFDNNGHADPFNKPTLINSTRYRVAKNRYDQNGWLDFEETNTFIRSLDLASQWMQVLMNKSLEEKGKPGS